MRFPRPSTVLSSLSLLMAISAGVMWVRSYFRGDSFDYATSPYKAAQWRCGFGSYDGRFSIDLHTFFWPSIFAYRNVNGKMDLAEDWGWTSGSEAITTHDHWPLWSDGDWNHIPSRFGFYGGWTHEADRTIRYVYVPYFAAVIIALILPLWWTRRKWRRVRLDRRWRQGLCLICGYDLRAHSPGQRCPECGTVIVAEEPLHQPSRWGRAILLVLLLLCTVTTGGFLFWRSDVNSHLRPPSPPSPDAVASQLRPGMTGADVGEFVPRQEPDPQFDNDLMSDGKSLSQRIPLAEGVNLVCVWPGRQPFIAGSKLQSFDVVRFDEIRPLVSDGLFESVRLVHLSPSPVGSRFSPVALIRAVNGLLPLGKARALQVLRDYVGLAKQDWTEAWRHDMDADRAAMVARLLFVPDDDFPEVGSDKGVPIPGVGPHKADWPLFPLVVQNDIPFCTIDGYFVGDRPSLAALLDYCEKNCRLRDTPLVPGSTPLQAVDVVCTSGAWKRRFGTEIDAKRSQGVLRIQAMRAVGHAVTNRRDDEWMTLGHLSPETEDRVWRSLLQEKQMSDVRWDAAKQEFIRIEE